MALGWGRHFDDMLGWSRDLCEISTRSVCKHRLLFVGMVELLTKAALEEGTWAERWGRGERRYLHFCRYRMGNAWGLNASLSAPASAQDDKTHGES